VVERRRKSELVLRQTSRPGNDDADLIRMANYSKIEEKLFVMRHAGQRHGALCVNCPWLLHAMLDLYRPRHSPTCSQQKMSFHLLNGLSRTLPWREHRHFSPLTYLLASLTNRYSSALSDLPILSICRHCSYNSQCAHTISLGKWKAPRDNRRFFQQQSYRVHTQLGFRNVKKTLTVG
jgi:hypothetical protein